MKYAIVSINNRQYKVSEGDELLIDKVNTELFDIKALLISDNGKLLLGKPYIDKAKISVKVVDKEIKGEKVKVFKYKAKSRYRKRIGFRPLYTKLLVNNISY